MEIDVQLASKCVEMEMSHMQNYLKLLDKVYLLYVTRYGFLFKISTSPLAPPLVET